MTFAAVAAVPTARWCDRNVFGGRIRDTWGMLRWHEDWANATPVPEGLDARWMSSSPRPLRIAHALGASGTAAENTLAAMQASARKGFLLFEVDVWLDNHGVLRCHHGPAPPAPQAPGDCLLARLLPDVAAVDGWAILDVKTDFERTGNEVIRLLRSDGLAAHAVFQLYLPQHTALFSDWALNLRLPAPIITAYGAHRGVQHIADQLARLNVKAMALPFPARIQLLRRPHDTALLLHPVHDCIAFRNAVEWGAAGVFILNTPPCV